MFWWLQLLHLCLLTHAQPQPPKVPLYIGSMAPLSGSRAWWGAGITAAMKWRLSTSTTALTFLLSYELRLLANDTMGETGLGNKILYDYIREGKPSLVLGPGRSNVALSVADTAKYWKMIQISASAESGDLSDSMTYPYFFRTISSISASKSTFVALAKKFKWKRISILFYSRDMYITAASDLKEECERNNITVLSYGSFRDVNDADNQLKHIKDIDARIVFAFLQKTTSVMCLIHKHNLYGTKYGWIVHTPDKRGWWKRTRPFLDCTPEQVNEAAEYSISIDHLYISKDNVSTVSGLTPQQFSKRYDVYANDTNVQTSLYGPFGFDAAWLIAIALNSSIDKLPNPQLSVNIQDLRVDNASEIIKDSLLKTRFPGVTGEVQLEGNGDRTGKFEVFQIRGSEFDLIAFHDATNPDNLTYYKHMEFQWRNGMSPRDHIIYKDRLIQLSQGSFIVMCVLASMGISLCFGFLYFNVVNRKERCIKMSSPNINNAIIVGCILAYISVILFSVDGERLTSFICKAKVFTLDIGFTIAFGSLFSKTWRVHRITRKIRVRRRVIKDIHLFGMIVVFLFVDTCIIIIWSIVDPLRKDNQYHPDEANELHADIIYRPMSYHCATNNSFVWLLLVYGFKGILLIFGLFLAWETRKVKIAALNDSHHIGMAVYNVFIVCTIGVPMAIYSEKQQYELSFYVITICIVFCTTLTLCLVFVPKIRVMRKKNCEEAPDRFPTNGIKYETKDINYQHESSLKNKELQKEIKRLQGVLEKAQMEKDKMASKMSHLVSKPSCIV
ncbi:hypothetical protein OS493_009876 [Desmophyllum pertusum]|uniref:G-protein coupled receptors family 3 profile domain-containing protein n=1 Tax=Desmophyllum pertusum TaxID=174260 RepID=A0A9X0CNB2_9CNID|nr:hypothetical protein OS493_009876 [Desmophyllum pertusum]